MYEEPPFYNDIQEYWEDWKMSDKRSYKDILASVETHFIYINNHLDNIDKHLERQNNSLTEHERSIAKNSTWIMAFRWIIGLLVVAIGACITGYLGVW